MATAHDMAMYFILIPLCDPDHASSWPASWRAVSESERVAGFWALLWLSRNFQRSEPHS
jgi:hypothetical protein